MNELSRPSVPAAGCCPAEALADAVLDAAAAPPPGGHETPADPSAFVRTGDGGLAHLDVYVEGVHCAACIRTVEGAAMSVPGVEAARLNLTTRRLHLAWHQDRVDAGTLLGRIARRGYRPTPFDPAVVAATENKRDRALLLAMAVAGFAAANVMLLSVAVWAGADMGAATRDLFHWVSALIALPAIAFAGRPFFTSALAALKRRQLNMDVPISLAVLLAAAMSLADTMGGGEHAYFDAAVTLLFFLLVGRYLDLRARVQARSAAENLQALSAMPARVVGADGRTRSVPLTRVRVGAVVAVAAGERIPVDGEIIDGRSDVDTAMVTGEPVPKPAGMGDAVYAGTMNLTGPLRVRSTARADASVLAEIVRLMETAEQGRARYVRLADRAAALYAPAVHLLGLLTFVGWFGVMDAGWRTSLQHAVAVLIITCPCALALAVPVVQVVASGVLMRLGVLMKSPDGLERLARADWVVFDKTGTLTEGRPRLVDGAEHRAGSLEAAAALARASRHPLSQALAAAVAGPGPSVTDVTEVPGFGLKGTIDGRPARLGHRAWCGVAGAAPDDGAMELWFAHEGTDPERFTFTDAPVHDAARTVARLQDLGLEVEILSGDRTAAVAPLARELGVRNWRAEARPGDKVARLEELKRQGHRVLMVGDGINDAPALAAGFVSLSPALASDIAQSAADVVLQGRRRMPIVTAIRTARLADRLVKQNFALALTYNAIAIPVAVAGLATPLIAAAAMSTSSVLVSLNALRLNWFVRERRP